MFLLSRHFLSIHLKFRKYFFFTLMVSLISKLFLVNNFSISARCNLSLVVSQSVQPFWRISCIKYRQTKFLFILFFLGGVIFRHPSQTFNAYYLDSKWSNYQYIINTLQDPHILIISGRLYSLIVYGKPCV